MLTTTGISRSSRITRVPFDSIGPLFATHRFVRFTPQVTATPTVKKVNNQSYKQPDDETDPSRVWQASHQKYTHSYSQQRYKRYQRYAELPRALRFARTRDENADANQDKCKERSNVGEFDNHVDVCNSGEKGYECTR